MALVRHLFILLSSSILTSCVNLNYVHDPETGLIGRDAIPGFLKSVRCELKTFYFANAYRRQMYVAALANAARSPGRSDIIAVRAKAIRDYPHFTLADELFGGVFLELKVVDTLGIGTGDTNVNYKQATNATHSNTYIVSPTLNSQNTYDMNLNFIIDQKDSLSLSTSQAEPFRCYNSNWKAVRGSPDDLAIGALGDAEEFQRIRVNGSTPLAYWLLQNSTQMWDNFVAGDARAQAEQLIPVQMNYSFAIQVSAGADARFSLTAPLWAPAQVGAIASSVQTSQIQIYLNGTDASLAAGAKLGTAVNSAAASDKPNPAPFVPVKDIEKLKELMNKEAGLKTRLQGLLVEKGISIESQKPLSDDTKKTLHPAAPAIVDELRKIQSQESALSRDIRRRPVAPSTGGPGTSRGYLLYPSALPAQ